LLWGGLWLWSESRLSWITWRWIMWIHLFRNLYCWMCTNVCNCILLLQLIEPRCPVNY
jgi:hypothetical protein